MNRPALAALIPALALLAAAARSAPNTASAPATAPATRSASASSSAPACEPTSAYTRRQLRGWTVYVNHRLLEDKKDVGDKALELLDVKLYDIIRAVPAKAVDDLRKIPIWLEYDNPQVKCACYHPSREWLAGHGFNPEKAGAVEIGNARTFLAWSHEQPAMVLHELAHGYHHRVLGHDNADIRSAFKHAMDANLYDSVLYFTGETKRAYAATNFEEYFAELTEAWFGTNDFYPFVRAEVLKHDPQMAEVLKKVWGR